MALFFGGLIQIIAAILEIIRGNLLGAVVFGTYGPFWVIFGVLQTLYVSGIPVGAVNSALALFLAMFAVLTFYFFIASLRTDMVLAAVFALIFIGLVLLAIGAGAALPDVTKAGDWVTLAFAGLVSRGWRRHRCHLRQAGAAGGFGYGVSLAGPGTRVQARALGGGTAARHATQSGVPAAARRITGEHSGI